MIEECVHWQEGRIDRYLKMGKDYIEANTKDWMIAFKDFVVRTLKERVLPWIMSFIFSAGRSQAASAAPPPSATKEEPSDTASNIADD